MRAARLAAALCLLTLGAAAAEMPLPSGQPVPETQLASFLDGVIADGMATDHIAGLQIVVVQDGRQVFLKGYGTDGTRPVDPSATLFRVGSITKTFTWIALLREVEQGRIRLDAPVNDYLPDAAKIPGQGFREPVRIWHLLSHSAGFEDRALGHLMVNQPRHVMALGKYLPLFRPDRVREPGVLASYSNYGAALAGYIVATVRGEDYETIVEREILAPLGMNASTMREPYPARPGLPAPMPAALAAHVSPGFAWNGEEYRKPGYEFISQVGPAGAASATAADMGRYMLAQLQDGVLGGVRIYGPKTATAFRTPLLEVPDDVNGWAHGLMMRRLPGGFQSYGHGGAVPTFYANMVLVPELKLGVFVGGNTNTSRSLVDRLPRLLVERFYAPPPAAAKLPGDPALAAAAARYAGSYLPTRRPYSGLEMLVSTFGNSDKVTVTPSGYLLTRVSGGAQSWVPDGPDGQFRSADGDGQRMRFTLDERGRAVSFLYARGNATMQRIGFWRGNTALLLAGGLATAAALVTWIAAIARLGDKAAATMWQLRSRRIALTAAALWLVAAGAFGFVALTAGGGLMFAWPSPALLTSSTAALLAAIASLAALLLLPAAWRGGGWHAWRRAGHTIVVLLFMLAAIVTGLRGGLLPWA